MNNQCFISYCTTDHVEVKKLVRDLEESNIKVWFDEKEIRGGEKLTDEIISAIRKSKYFCIWLTQNSIKSKWVEYELDLRVSHQLNSEHKVYKIIPLYVENCSVPMKIINLKRIDFSSSYQNGLNELKKIINIENSNVSSNIMTATLGFLDDLSSVQIKIPTVKPINIIKSLKKLPRTGKKFRFQAANIQLPARSVYDHIISVAHTADCLFPIIKHGLKKEEALEVGRCIAYHEVCEVFIGDIPSYTSMKQETKNIFNIPFGPTSEEYTDRSRESITNNFIAMYLGNKERKSLQKVNEFFNEKDNPITLFFTLIDKIDPIIAIWRYLYYFGGRLEGKQNIDKFLLTTKDFFNNPDVKDIAKNYEIYDPIIYKIVIYLLDMDHAKKYYHTNIIDLPEHSTLIRKLIEETKLYVELNEKYRNKNKKKNVRKRKNTN